MTEYSFRASYLLVTGLAELSNEYDVDTGIALTGVSRSSAIFMSNLPASEVTALCQHMKARSAVTFDINQNEISKIAELISGFSFFQCSKLLAANDAWVKSMSLGLLRYRKALADTYFEYLLELLDVVERNPGNAKFDNFSPYFITFFEKFDSQKTLLLLRLIVQRNLIKLRVSRTAVDLAVAAFKPKLNERIWIQSWVKAGASLEFLERYGGIASFDVSYFRQCRKLHEEFWKPEKADTKKVFSAFLREMAEKEDVTEIYLALGKKFGLRVETIYLIVQKSLKKQHTKNDELLFKEVKALLA